MTDISIAYIVFNRPRHTRETFQAIRAARPARLFIIADGPRPGHPTDDARCQVVREIVSQIDWPCEVQRNYADQNLGLKKRVSSGLDWVFSQVERAIILEDDCLPHPDFFPFCQELLERYKDDERVWTITGNNNQNGKKRSDDAYYFSKYGHCWGWATWRRAWAQYDGDIKFWPEWKLSQDWRNKTPDSYEQAYWIDIFDRIYLKKIDSWAYPWMTCLWYHGGLTATPRVNLVTNIGVGPDSTHTLADKDQPGVPLRPLGQLTHPPEVRQHLKADQYVFDHLLGGLYMKFPRTLLKFPIRVKNKLIRMWKGQP
ncbi:MAG: glycosyltransferase family 2 protein [Burkholderiaceae bacterium]|nr:glycosyltransferase family 2 protein [Burkholderiaceae bacterium]